MRENIIERRSYIKSLLESGSPIDVRELAREWKSSPVAITVDISVCNGDGDPYYHKVHPVDAQNMRAKRIGAEGVLTKDGWEAVLDSNGRACVACGSPDDIAIDHIFPLSKGGRNSDDNVQPLCRSCNVTKRDKITDTTTLRETIAKRNGKLDGRPRILQQPAA